MRSQDCARRHWPLHWVQEPHVAELSTSEAKPRCSVPAVPCATFTMFNAHIPNAAACWQVPIAGLLPPASNATAYDGTWDEIVIQDISGLGFSLQLVRANSACTTVAFCSPNCSSWHSRLQTPSSQLYKKL